MENGLVRTFGNQYQNKKKRDIRTWLPLLTEKDKDGLFVVARCDWFDVVSDVYNECYFEPLVKWLKERNMYYISNLWEESLQLQTIAVGDLMKTTRCVTMPGNDCLEMKSQDVHDFKEIQSVAEFEDRPFMSEIMGVAGWIQSPEMMKMTINSVTSFGVNHVVPHGIYMNRQLETVPFPSDWFTENPYWNYLHQWTDFCQTSSLHNPAKQPGWQTFCWFTLLKPPGLFQKTISRKKRCTECTVGPARH